MYLNGGKRKSIADMSRSEFRWNKKRKHYAYLHKDIGSKRMNILISSKAIMVIKKNRGGKQTIKNVSLWHHPNPVKNGQFYLIPKNYIDEDSSFDTHAYKNWSFNRHDKRKVKRIKKLRKL